MPVQTGFEHDDDAAVQLLADAEQNQAGQPPPEAIAGIDALETDANPEPTIDVRGRTFRLRSEVPGLLLTKLSQTQVRAQKAPKDNLKQTAAAAALHEMIVKLVVAEDQSGFEDHCIDVEPPIELEELLGILKDMMEAVTGRPTRQPSGSAPG